MFSGGREKCAYQGVTNETYVLNEWYYEWFQDLR